MSEIEVGPWAKDKLERLRKYLHAYTTIMKEQEWCVGFAYVDAFAGPGKHHVRAKRGSDDLSQLDLHVVTEGTQGDDDQRAFLAGSPRVALDLEFPFTWNVFIEKSPDRVQLLNELKEEFSGRRHVWIVPGDCNDYLMEKIAGRGAKFWKSRRAIVFLDPFGMQVPWSTIAAIGSTNAVEIFLNFPVGMAIQRLLPRDPKKLTASRRRNLDVYFGSSEWYDVVYRKEERRLFDEEITVKSEQAAVALVNWYRGRLKSAFGFASNAALIRNSHGGHLYYLMLATPNPTGLKIANHVLSAGKFI